LILLSFSVSVAPGFAADLPGCDSKAVLGHVKRAYQGMLMLEGSNHKFRGEGVKETATAHLRPA
jgi:hypothetical protein